MIISRNGNSLEVCMKIVTDSNIINEKFKSVLSVSYDDPNIIQWSDWSDCFTKNTYKIKRTLGWKL